MDNIEIYTYTRDELVNGIQTIKYPNGNTNKVCFISNVESYLYNTCDNKNNKVGVISFTNNVTENEDISFTTSIGTIITPFGSLVVNFSYNNRNGSQFLPIGKTVKAKPTFTSGLYENYDNITVTVFSVEDSKSTRILTISY